jgi:hypothetical protein
MGSNTDISALYREFTDALTEVLAKMPPPEAALKNWEALQNVGR